MTFLETLGNTQKPKCIIRIDIAHIIKLVYQWKCFNGKHIHVKDFYVRCFGLLTKCTSIDQFHQIFRDILIVSASDIEEEITNEQIRCLTAQQRLIQVIKIDTVCDFNYNTDDFTDENLTNYLDNIDLDDNKYGMKIIRFLQCIQCESKPSDTGERPNPYWYPQFGSNVLKLAKYFPLWTAVMSPHVASSMYSEQYFRELKQLMFKDAKCMRVDKFLVIHIRSLAGTVKLLQSKNLHATPNNSDDSNDNIDLPKSNVQSLYIVPNITNHNDFSTNARTDDPRVLKSINDNDKYVDTEPLNISPIDLQLDSNISKIPTLTLHILMKSKIGEVKIIDQRSVESIVLNCMSRY